MAVAPQARPRPTKDQARPPSSLGTARLVVVRPPRVALWDGIRVNIELEEKGDGGVSNSSGWEVEALPQRHFTFSHPEMESEKRVAATRRRRRQFS